MKYLLTAAGAALFGLSLLGQAPPSPVATIAPPAIEVAVANAWTRGKGNSLTHLDLTCRSMPGQRCG